MKWYGVVCILFCFGAMGWAQDAPAAMQPPGDWRAPIAWRQLAKKMTESQIIELLGQPLEKETVEQFEVWYYQDTPKRENGQIVWRPKTAMVRFKQVTIEGQQTYLLLDWKTPDWHTLLSSPPTLPIVFSDPAGAFGEPNAMAKPAEKAEVNEPVIQAQTPPPPPPEPKPDTSLQGRVEAAKNWFKTVPRIWLWIGGAVAAFIIYAILKPDPRYKKQRPKRPDVEL